MSGGNRGQRSQDLNGLALIAAVILSCVVVAAIAYSQGREGERRYQSPHNHAESAKASAERACIRANPGAMFECVYEKIEASEETSRAEQDLDAQQWMSFWALAMTLMAAVTAVISAVALIFLRDTLKETRVAVSETSKATKAMLEANKIARDQFEAGYRPLLKVELFGPLVKDEDLHYVRGQERTFYLRVGVKITNYGVGDCQVAEIAIRPDNGWWKFETIGAFLKSGDWIYGADPRRVESYFAHIEAFQNRDPNTPLLVQHSIGATRTEGSLIGTPLPDIIGIIRYTDMIGVIREHGFAFRPWSIVNPKFQLIRESPHNFDRKANEQA